MVNSIEETTMVTVSGQTHYPLELLSKCRMVKTEVRLVLVSLSGVVSQLGCFASKIEIRRSFRAMEYSVELRTWRQKVSHILNFWRENK